MKPVTESIEDTRGEARAGEYEPLDAARAPASAHGEGWLRTVLRDSSIVVTILEADGTVRYVNEAIRGMLGYAPEELVGTAAFDLVHPDDAERTVSEFAEATARPGTHWGGVENRLRHRDGSWRHVRGMVTNLLEDPAVGGIVVASTDITHRVRAEEARRRSEARLAESQRIAHLGTWEWDVASGEVWWSEEMHRIYGFEPGEISPSLEAVEKRFHPDDRHLLREKIGQAFLGAEFYDFEHRVVRRDGEIRWVHRQAEVVRGPGGEPTRMIGTVLDVTERKALEERLERQALLDPLTGLPNRKLFFDRLEQALRRTERRDERGVAVLFMDLDDFKVINDSLGHEPGDRLLVPVADRLRGCLRPEDTLARFGGDEFVVMLEGSEGAAGALRVAERAIEGLREPFPVDGRSLHVGASIGISLGDARTKSPEDLLRDADTAMYEAKEEGVSYRVFDPAMYERVVGRLELENDLRRAVERGEFVVHYQPIVRLGNGGGVWGFEALARWRHPEQGLLGPEDFIPAAEESGLIVAVGEWVLVKACEHAARWQERFPTRPPLSVSVNLSARQMRQPDMEEVVFRALRGSGLPASSLTLDMTETVYITAFENDTAALDRLKATGVGVSIDDFGTGYSSLAYLKRLPAEVLKLDRSFVGGLGLEAEDTAVVQTIVDLAHIMGMEVVAEGVETEYQAAMLREMGCDFGQGHWFSRPLPCEEIGAYLERGAETAANVGP